MKIINLEEFRKLPENTLYSKYTPMFFDSLEIKGETWKCDFLSQSLHDAIECDSSDEMMTLLTDAKEIGTSLEMDFNCQSRDGIFNDDQLFAVWEKRDVEKLINRLMECL